MRLVPWNNEDEGLEPDDRKRKRANVATVDRLVEQLLKALNTADLDLEDVLPVRWVHRDVVWPLPNSRERLLAATKALHAFYCEQTGTPDASMARNGGKRRLEGNRGDAPALRFVVECLRTRNRKITVAAVHEAFYGRNSKAKKAM